LSHIHPKKRKKEEVVYGFIDLEMRITVLREISRCTLMKKDLPKVFVNVIEDMYQGVCIRVKSLCEETKDFSVRVGVHQSSGLSHYLFSLIMNVIIKDIQGEVL